jgi:hypothetical protein
MTTTTTRTSTRVQTATHLTDVILGTISGILADVAIRTGPLQDAWTTYEDGIREWIIEGALEKVVLECHSPAGRLTAVFEFPVAYDITGAGNTTFTASRARLARFAAKIDRMPAGSTFNIVCSFSITHSSQPGWGPTTLASTTGMQSISFGTLGSAPHASAGMRYLY